MQIPVARPLFKPPANLDSKLLFYTYANEKYHEFAILYPLFALLSNKDSIVEICISAPDIFVSKYTHLIKYYVTTFPGRFLYSYICNTNIFPNSIRFLVKPVSRAEYIYIGDVDIIVLEENILDMHRLYMKKNSLEFSNVKRKGENKLTGLHCMEYKKFFPASIPEGVNISSSNDEELLFLLMQAKGYIMPEVTDLMYRPVHGVHISFFSRPPLQTLTTQDRVAETPSWLGQSEDTSVFIKKYLDIRYTQPVTAFMSAIRDSDIPLRRLIQFIDMFCHYAHQNYVMSTSAQM